MRDTRLMAEELCEIEIGDDLVKHAHQVTAGSARAIRVALERLGRFGRRKVSGGSTLPICLTISVWFTGVVARAS